MKSVFSFLTVAFLATVSEAVSVKDFGAVGDGVHDDTLAIQKAADSLYPGGEYIGGRDMAYFADRYRKSIIDGPNGEVFFPKGTYRLTGPVRFLWSVSLRGEDGATILGADPGKDVFYFHIGFRVQLENLAFRGGHIQVRQWTRNLSDAVLHVRNCTFAGASDRAVLSDSWHIRDDMVDTPENASKGCPPYEIKRLASGLYDLKERDPATLKGWPNSTEVVVEGCRFEGNRQAFDLNTDGVFIRDSSVVADVRDGGAAAKVGTTAHLKRVRFAVSGSGAAVEVGRDTVVDGCRFDSCEGVVPVLWRFRPFRSNIATQLILKNSSISGKSAEVVCFKDGYIPNQIVVDGLSAADGVRRRLFAFGRAPSSEEIENWPTECSKGVRWGHPVIPVRHCFGVTVRNLDTSLFDASLPASIEPFRRAEGTVPRAHGVRLAPEADFSGASVRMSDESCGSGCRDLSRDDTAALRKLFSEPVDGTNGLCVVLQPRWYRVTGMIPVSGRVRLVCRGRAAIISTSDQPVFALAEGSEVLIENAIVQGGRNAVRCEGRRGHVLLRYDNLYGQLEEAVSAAADGDNDWLIELSAGSCFCPYFYRGNAHVKIDGYWFSLGSDRPRGQPYPADFASVVNLAGGVFEAEDVCGVPRYFDNDEVFTFKGDRSDPKLKGNYRWFDNYGTMILLQFRFGGERGGLTSICHFPGARTHVEGGFAAFRSNWRLTATPLTFLAMPGSDERKLRCVDVIGFDFLDRKPMTNGQCDNSYPY